MTTRPPAEEIAAKGQALYDERIRPLVENGNHGRILVVDIETGDYVLDDDHLRATHRAMDAHPGAILYSVRVGFPTLGKIGGGWGGARQP